MVILKNCGRLLLTLLLLESLLRERWARGKRQKRGRETETELVTDAYHQVNWPGHQFSRQGERKKDRDILRETDRSRERQLGSSGQSKCKRQQVGNASL